MTDKETPIGRTLQGLKQKFSERLPSRIGQIEWDFRLLAAVPWDKETAMRTHMELHKLSGTGGSFGFKELSEAARRCEEFLALLIKHNGPLTRTHKKELSAGLDRLRDAAAQAMHRGGGTAG
jgi:chemotaxis protein histidine kinase CheA